MPTLVVDANPILAALLGGRARDIFFAPGFRFLTTRYTLQEVERHLATIAEQSGVPVSHPAKALRLLPLELVAKKRYATHLKKAKRLLRDIDPSDADILALALATKKPLWSNDKHFEQLAERVKLVKTKGLF